MKVLVCDQGGACKSSDDYELLLNNWAVGYCYAGPEKDNYSAMKAHYPLGMVRVSVTASQRRSEVFSATATILPHFQLERVDSGFEFTFELPAPLQELPTVYRRLSDVYIAYASEDWEIAKFLEKCLLINGYRVACPLQEEEKHFGGFCENEVDAPELASCLVIIASNGSSFGSHRLDFSWRTFIEEIWADRKSTDSLLILAGTGITDDLPPALREFHVIQFNNSTLSEAAEQISTQVRGVIESVNRKRSI